MTESIEIQIIRAKMETLGWMYAFACNALDKGEDIRDMEVPEILERMHQDLNNQSVLPALDPPIKKTTEVGFDPHMPGELTGIPEVNKRLTCYPG